MEEEIDLRQYVEVLLKYKFWIAGLAVLAAAVAFAMGSRRPLVYEAEASLAILRDRAEVVLEPKYKTLSEDDLSPRVDLRSLRETLSALVKSSSVAAAVLEQMGDQLNGDVQGLQGKVTVGNNGNLITIRVRDRKPELAAEIANVWAQQAEVYINSIYGQPSQPVQELQAQFQEVQVKYMAAQGDLEAFVAQDQTHELEREIKHRQDLIASYQESLTDNEAAIYSEALASDRMILSDYYAELAVIEQVLVDARSLQDELQRSGSAPATEWAEALVFVGLQNRAFGEGEQQLQVILDGEAPATAPQDLERLIGVLAKKAADMRAAIAQQEQQLFDVTVEPVVVASENPVKQRIQALTEEMAALQSQLEAESARSRELTQARDLAWETFETVARKLAEAEVAVQIPGSEVRLATRALQPKQPLGRGRLMNTVVAGMLGLMVGVFGAFALEWWRQGPSIDEEIEASEPVARASQVDN